MSSVEGSSDKESGEVIRASASKALGKGSFVLVKNGQVSAYNGRLFEHVTPVPVPLLSICNILCVMNRIIQGTK